MGATDGTKHRYKMGFVVILSKTKNTKSMRMDGVTGDSVVAVEYNMRKWGSSDIECMMV